MSKLSPEVVVEYPAGGTQPKPEAAESPRLTYRRLADVVARAIDWLWKGVIAKAKLTMVAGHPGLGKSQATLSVAAAVSTGGRLPDGNTAEPGNVIIVSAEDDAADTVVPRLAALGANLEKIYVVDAVRDGNSYPDGTPSERGFNLIEDLAKLSKMTKDLGDVALIIFDPISAYLGSTDSHKNSDVRAVLAPLSKLAEQCGAAIVAVSHLNKSGGADALARVTGSLAFVAAARAAYLVCKDPEDEARRLFLPLKNNLGADGTGLAFRVESAQVPGAAGAIDTSHVVWESGAVTMTAAEALRVPSGNSEEGGAAVADAAEWLSKLLADGPITAKDVRAEATAAGHYWRTVRRAKDRLRIRPFKDGLGGPWFWRLAEGVHEGGQEGVQGQSMDTFEDVQDTFEGGQGLGTGGLLGHLRGGADFLK